MLALRWMYRTHRAVLSLCFAVACGSSEGRTEHAPAATPTVQPAGEAPIAAERADVAVEEEPGLLADLEQGDTLTYRVRRETGHELDVQMRITRVVARGSSKAVQLSPFGTPMSDTAPVYPRWIIGTPSGLFGLLEHVALTAPGFEPLDARGQLVTEARTNVAWRVPPAWLAPAAGAFETDPEEGWMLAGHEARVEGPVGGERCVRMERADGSLRTRMLVCANVGMMESTTTGAPAEAAQSWRLVDLGGETSPELRER